MTVARTPFADLPTALITELADAGLDPRRVYDGVVDAVDEDLPGPDVTSEATVPPRVMARADVTARASGVLAGGPVAEMVLRFVVGSTLRVGRIVPDGSTLQPGDVVMSVVGPARGLLTAERVALNHLCHLSGVATMTRAWVDALADSGVHVRDTRKTTPQLRELEQYAVRCGGGLTNRSNLSDSARVKANHAVAAGGVVAAYEAVRRHAPETPVQVEVTTLEQLTDLLTAGAEELLLDGMDLVTMKEAVTINAGRACLEATSGTSLELARELAATGVDYLAVGALTHSARALDVEMVLSTAGSETPGAPQVPGVPEAGGDAS